jgi:hypothetical protein
LILKKEPALWGAGLFELYDERKEENVDKLLIQARKIIKTWEKR